MTRRAPPPISASSSVRASSNEASGESAYQGTTWRTAPFSAPVTRIASARTSFGLRSVNPLSESVPTDFQPSPGSWTCTVPRVPGSARTVTAVSRRARGSFASPSRVASARPVPAHAAYAFCARSRKGSSTPLPTVT